MKEIVMENSHLPTKSGVLYAQSLLGGIGHLVIVRKNQLSNLEEVKRISSKLTVTNELNDIHIYISQNFAIDFIDDSEDPYLKFEWWLVGKDGIAYSKGDGSYNKTFKNYSV